MPRRLVWAILPALFTATAVAAAPRGDEMTADLVRPLTVATAPEHDWRDAAAADVRIGEITVATVQPSATARRPAAPATIASRTIARLPEPATWVMLILGFGGIGAAVRRQLRRSDERFEEHLRRIAASADEG